MYLIADTTKYELPLDTADTLRELAALCGTNIPNVCRIIRQQWVTLKYQGLPARIYKIDEIDDCEKEYDL